MVTRSRIEAFDETATVLSDTADQLRAGAQRLQQAADAYVEQMNAPNGSHWEGQTATQFFEDAHTDRLSVYRSVDHANAVADIAAGGADSLRGGRQQALQAIAQAEQDDFTVGEDLSVTDNYSWNSPANRATRQQAALAHRDYIAHCATRLETENGRIAAKLNAGASEIAGMVPAHWREPATVLFQPASTNPETNKSKRQGTVQAVDNHWKQAPSPTPTPPPNPGGMTRTEAAERLKDVNRRIAEHNDLKRWIETLPPHDPRRLDFSIDTKLLNDEKAGLLAILPPQMPPTTLIGPNGEKLPGVLPGLISQMPTENGSGWIYPIAPNQPGIDPRVVAIRVMAPTPNYPNGYVVYMNDAQPTPQTVNPFTGQTIPPTDRYAHIPPPKR